MLDLGLLWMMRILACFSAAFRCCERLSFECSSGLIFHQKFGMLLQDLAPSSTLGSEGMMRFTDLELACFHMFRLATSQDQFVAPCFVS